MVDSSMLKGGSVDWYWSVYVIVVMQWSLLSRWLHTCIRTRSDLGL